jgi:hypothetical protein
LRKFHFYGPFIPAKRSKSQNHFTNDVKPVFQIAGRQLHAKGWARVKRTEKRRDLAGPPLDCLIFVLSQTASGSDPAAAKETESADRTEKRGTSTPACRKAFFLPFGGPLLK